MYDRSKWWARVGRSFSAIKVPVLWLCQTLARFSLKSDRITKNRFLLQKTNGLLEATILSYQPLFWDQNWRIYDEFCANWITEFWIFHIFPPKIKIQSYRKERHLCSHSADFRFQIQGCLRSLECVFFSFWRDLTRFSRVYRVFHRKNSEILKLLAIIKQMLEIPGE